MLYDMMLSVTFSYFYYMCRHAECHVSYGYAERHYTVCRDMVTIKTLSIKPHYHCICIYRLSLYKYASCLTQQF
jgi:hypothetical protein